MNLILCINCSKHNYLIDFVHCVNTIDTKDFEIGSNRSMLIIVAAGRMSSGGTFSKWHTRGQIQTKSYRKVYRKVYTLRVWEFVLQKLRFTRLVNFAQTTSRDSPFLDGEFDRSRSPSIV